MEQTIGGRIKQVRKEAGLSQQKFAEVIGAGQSTIAGYENGTKNPIDPIIKSICREFNISEAWLRNGEEPKNADEARRKALARAPDDSFRDRFITALLELPADFWPEIQRFIQSLSKD